MDKNQLLKLMRMSPEETEAYAEPSIMDEWIKQNDPEQWDKIQSARNTQDAINLGMSTAGMTKLPRKGLMGRFAPIRKDIKETKLQLPKDIYEKATSHLEKETPDFGKVKKTDIPEADIGKVTAKELPEEVIGNVKQMTPEEELTLMQRIEKMSKTLNEDPKFARLNRLLQEKKKQKGE
jgi:hypothetical protein